MRAIIAGGGIVGLTTGLALKSMGADVVVCEQATEIRAAGAAIGLWENALDVFAEFGVGDAVRSIGAPIETWFYDASGNRFRAPGYGPAEHRFLLVPRPELNRTLADAIGADNIALDARVIGFEEDADGVTVRFGDGRTDRADLLIGADGVYSMVREQLVPGYPARDHVGHHVWRGIVETGDEPAEGSVLTVGHHRTRGGYTPTYGGKTVWMVNQFDSAAPVDTHKREALRRASFMNDNGWGDPLNRLIERTPDSQILHNQIMYVPELPRWSGARVTLIGDAAHGLSPHISAGGTLGVEDVRVLIDRLRAHDRVADALKAYEGNRMPHYRHVHALAHAVEQARDAQEFAREYARFSRWMLTDGARHARQGE
ncbi:FAD-dependent oxidoreductase [Niveispirillum sp. KHB5.9]|uniref:FAD-dependent oxidoreductase n=1 Tax=Niveispirillum sp. KHB5.9 TaxID=3400269 RepID=UPI003A84A734